MCVCGKTCLKNYKNKIALIENVEGLQWNFHKYIPLRKHAYSNTKKISPPKTENFQVKNSNIFHISAQNIDCGYLLEPPQRGGSNEYTQSMF